MSGNCAIGIVVIAMMPASVMTMATTRASRGRSMKIPENISGSRHDVRSDDLTGAHLLDAFDDDQLSLLEAGGHDNVPASLGTGGYAALLHLLRGVDHEDITAGLVDQDSRLWNRQRRLRLTAFHAHTHNPAWDQQTLRIRQLRPNRHGVGAGIDLDVEEIVDAGMWIDAAVGQLDANRHLSARAPRFENPLLEFEHIPLACLKEDIDRILADDGRKLSGRGLNEVALGESDQPDPSIDG